jgi:hypothetical protein
MVLQKLKYLFDQAVNYHGFGILRFNQNQAAKLKTGPNSSSDLTAISPAVH